MSFSFGQACVELKPFVRQYWALENVMQPGLQHTQRIIPTGLIDLTFYLGNQALSEDPGREVNSHSLISGQSQRPYDLTVQGTVSVFSISFNPQGAYRFFDLPMYELTDRTLSLRNIHQDWVDEVEDKLFESPEFKDRVRIVDAFLLRLLRDKERKEGHPRLLDSIQLIDRTRGMVDVTDLARRACLSRKQYERLFKSSVGVSPKRFLRIIRLQNAIHKRQLDKELSLTGLAYDAGYYDQSHMIRDFQGLTGMTPGEYFSDCEPLSDYFV